MDACMIKDPRKIHLDMLRHAKSTYPEEYYQLSALNNLRKARLDLLMAGNIKASNLVQNLIDVLRPYGAISEEDD